MIALAPLGVPFSALSQTSLRVSRIGFLVPRSSANLKGRVEAFQAGLRVLGYVEGKNLAIEWRFADGEYDWLPALANELVQSKIDVLVVDSMNPPASRSSSHQYEDGDGARAHDSAIASCCEPMM